MGGNKKPRPPNNDGRGKIYDEMCCNGAEFIEICRDKKRCVPVPGTRSVFAGVFILRGSPFSLGGGYLNIYQQRRARDLQKPLLVTIVNKYFLTGEMTFARLLAQAHQQAAKAYFLKLQQDKHICSNFPIINPQCEIPCLTVLVYKGYAPVRHVPLLRPRHNERPVR